jgi:3-hydroxyacyl-[acyl-carrier-protein] dehydratase
VTEAAETVVGEPIDHLEVLRRIPHRHPFLLVDRCENFVPNQSIVGIKNVTANEGFFQGHFPGFPVMPGVLIVEALAQTGAILMSKTLDVDPRGKVIYFTSLDECRFRNRVGPGDTVELKVKVLQHRRNLFKFEGRAWVGQRLCAECVFSAMLAETGQDA